MLMKNDRKQLRLFKGTLFAKAGCMIKYMEIPLCLLLSGLVLKNHNQIKDDQSLVII